MRFVLGQLNLVNSKTNSKAWQQRCPRDVYPPHYTSLGYSACVHIGVGFSVVCFELRAIPEPS